MIKSEREFANFLDSQGLPYIHQPKTFKFNGISYRPDFYCIDSDTYYEVKTHLSFPEARKLLLFKKHFPNIKLKIVSPNGYPYYSPTSGTCIEAVDKVLGLLKSKDILEASLDELIFIHKNFPKPKGFKFILITEIKAKAISLIKKSIR